VNLRAPLNELAVAIAAVTHGAEGQAARSHREQQESGGFRNGYGVFVRFRPIWGASAPSVRWGCLPTATAIRLRLNGHRACDDEEHEGNDERE
jgi:hypothetical protein